MKKERNNQGITLVILVVIIIIVIALGGVIFKLILGNDKISNKTTEETNTMTDISSDNQTKTEGHNETGKNISKDETKAEGSKMKQSLVSQIKATNYGDKVNYSVKLDSVTLDDWRIFYNDGNVITMICQDYVPNNTSLITGTGLTPVVSDDINYSVFSDTSRVDLISRLEDTSKWEGLLTNTIKNKGATAKGAVDLNMWIESWNAKGYTHLNTVTTTMDDGLSGYYIGTEATPTDTEIDLSKDKGYNDQLYYPDHSNDKAYGYYLTSPSAYMTNYIMIVHYEGSVGDYHYYRTGLRCSSCNFSTI